MSMFSEIIKYNGIKSFIIIIILSLIEYYKCDQGTLKKTINYKFPNCIELNNHNILIIFEKGIYLYNSEISEELNKIEYETGFSLGQDDLNLINLSKFDEGVVISIIKTYIYLFSETGDKLYHSTLNITGATYYSLIPHKIEGDNYYFVISYKDKDNSNKLKIYYYCINTSDQTINEIKSLEYVHGDSSYEIHHNQGVSCQIISPFSSENVLTCFYEVQKSQSANLFLSASSFILGSTISLDNSIPFIYESISAGGPFKSSINSDKTKILICYSPDNNGGNCIFYNIKNNTFTEDKKYFNKCSNVAKGIHVDFFSKTKEFIFSCVSGRELTILKFDENGNALNLNGSAIDTNYNFDGYGLFSFSILFLFNNTQYSILYTANNENCFYYLLPETFNPSNISNTNE